MPSSSKFQYSSDDPETIITQKSSSGFEKGKKGYRWSFHMYQFIPGYPQGVFKHLADQYPFGPRYAQNLLKLLPLKIGRKWEKNEIKVEFVVFTPKPNSFQQNNWKGKLQV